MQDRQLHEVSPYFLWLFVSVFQVPAEGRINREVWFVITGVFALSLAVGGHLAFLNDDTFFIVHALCALVPMGTGLHLPFKAQWSLCAPSGLIFESSTVFDVYGPQNKQRLFPYTALTDWFLSLRW
jgi:hypothetical protein